MIQIVLIILALWSTSVFAKNCLVKLLELYPSQTSSMMRIRIENVQNKHKFMRAFIPYYYKEAYGLRRSLPVYEKLKDFKGVVVGDAHVGNFGFVANNKGKPSLTLNDFDDVSEAPLFLDVMRLSQSASYMVDRRQKKWIEAYTKGLNGTSHEYSTYVQKLERKAVQGGRNPKGDFTETPEGLRFTTRQKPTSSIPPHVLPDLEKSLKNKLGDKVVIHDSYMTWKESGGSAFGTRYHILADVDGKPQFIELKEIQVGGVVTEWTGKAGNSADRISKARDIFMGKSFEEVLDVVHIGKKPFQLRFKAKGNRSIDIEPLKPTEAELVIEDEFYLLGTLHRKSLQESGQLSEYTGALKAVTTDDWVKSVSVMQDRIKKGFKDAPNNRTPYQLLAEKYPLLKKTSDGLSEGIPAVMKISHPRELPFDLSEKFRPVKADKMVERANDLSPEIANTITAAYNTLNNKEKIEKYFRGLFEETVEWMKRKGTPADLELLKQGKVSRHAISVVLVRRFKARNETGFTTLFKEGENKLSPGKIEILPKDLQNPNASFRMAIHNGPFVDRGFKDIYRNGHGIFSHMIQRDLIGESVREATKGNPQVFWEFLGTKKGVNFWADLFDSGNLKSMTRPEVLIEYLSHKLTTNGPDP